MFFCHHDELNRFGLYFDGLVNFRYTKPEKLGKEYTCKKCAKPTHEAVKRLSIRKLPPVLSFQFKVRLTCFVYLDRTESPEWTCVAL